MKLSEKRENAKRMYVDSELKQYEIAAIVKVSAHTIGTWIKKYKWDELKGMRVLNKDRLLMQSYSSISKIHDEAEKEGRVITSAEADKIAKISKNIRDISGSVAVHEHIYVCTCVLEFVMAGLADKSISRADGEATAKVLDLYKEKLIPTDVNAHLRKNIR